MALAATHVKRGDHLAGDSFCRESDHFPQLFFSHDDVCELLQVSVPSGFW
jgi:hypothetical protein